MNKRSLCKKKFVSFFMALIMMTSIIPVNAESTVDTDSKNNVKNEEPVIMIGKRTIEEYNEAIDNGDIDEEFQAAEEVDNRINTFSMRSSSAVGTTTGDLMNYLPGIGAYRISINGKVAYCIDSSRNTPYDKTYSDDGSYDDDVLRAILYHGYPNNASKLIEKYGITEDEARYYTQVAIWQYLSPEFAEKSRGGYFDELYKLGKNKDLGGQRTFSLDQSEITMKVTGDYQESGVIKTSGSKGTFTFPSNENVWSVDVNGNKKNVFNVGDSFKIRSKAGLTEDIKIDVTSALYTPIGIKWVPTSECYQRLVEPVQNNKTVAVKKQVTLKFQSATVKVVKTDDNCVKLSGVEFGIYSDSDCKNLIATGTTDSNGTVTFSKLSYGNTYYVKETKGLTGYEVDSTVKKVVITCKTGEYTVAVTNKKIKGEIVVSKVDAKTNEALKGAEFKLYSCDNKLLKTLITDDNGEAKFTDLALGTYKLVESKAPNGYKLKENSEEVTLTETNRSVTVKIKNELLTGSFSILKVDGETGSYLSGAKFEVYDKSGNVIATVTTDENGSAKISGVPYGVYTIK